MFLVGALGVSRAQIQKFIHAGLVTVNGKLPKKPGDPLNRDSEIVIADEDPRQLAEETLEADSDMRDVHVEVIADEPEYIVVNKPAGLLVHPTDANEQVTLTRWLLERYPEVATVGDDPIRPGIVHRLDREASGLMVVAKTQAMFEFLKSQFQNRTAIFSFQKRYRLRIFRDFFLR
jgi:23S rRNA pseudouridine1911/1915/1917 synthase